jgi:hypothetical protein
MSFAEKAGYEIGVGISIAQLPNHPHPHRLNHGGMFVVAIEFLNRIAEVKVCGAFGDA